MNLTTPYEVARVDLPTPFGRFDVRAFQCRSGFVYLAMVSGDIGDGHSVLTRVHSECLTGDALGSLRCDCGVQLRGGLRAISAEGRGVFVYATGHEGRGIGLINKLRAYVEQDRGSDTVDANVHLGFAVDGREYAEAAVVLQRLGVKSVRLMTNNPEKVTGLQASGLQIESVRGVPVAAHVRNARYLKTKQDRLGHLTPLGTKLGEAVAVPVDVTQMLGRLRPRPTRPYVVLKYAQSIDGRIATATGESRWISGHAERTISHALRAHCDAIMVGIGTVLKDDPQLTVRMVPGASPVRVILDSALRIPLDARVIEDESATLVITTDRSCEAKREQLRERNVGVRVIEGGPAGVDLTAALRLLRDVGIQSLLVEGGAQLITSLLAESLVDRMIVGLAPIVMGAGIEGVGDLGVLEVAEGVSLTNRSVHLVDDDVLIAWDVASEMQARLPGVQTSLQR